MTIDAHQHFWRYNPVEFGWIPDPMNAIRRDFLPKDLRPRIDAAGIGGTVSVQARQTLGETEWLLGLAGKNKFIRGVVGWVDLQDRAVAEDLGRLAANPKLKAIRHVVQDEPDERFLSRHAFNRGIRALLRHSLAYDLLIYAWQLPHAIAFVDRHPNQLFVLDHLAKPGFGTGQFDDWARDLAKMGRRPHVYAKVSGLVTEAASPSWTPAQLHPYLDRALEIFGPRRLMFGSDWPVCLADSTYRRWWGVASEWAGRLTLSDRARLFGGTAMEAYNL